MQPPAAFQTGDILRGIIPLDVDWTELERTQQQQQQQNRLQQLHRQTAV